MMKRKNKFAALILALVLFIFMTLSASAVSAIKSEVTVVPGEIFYLPVLITENSGIMGFRITVDYDKELLEPISVESGSLTENGMLDNNISLGNDGSFDVVWSSTENSTGDGTLAIIGFRASEKLSGSTSISVAFSKDDTFNEAYEDVVINDFTVEVSSGTKTSVISDEIVSGNDNTVAVVNSALSDYGDVPINELSDEQQAEVLEKVNSEYSEINGTDEVKYDSFEALESDYTDATKEDFALSVADAVDYDTYTEAVNNALEGTGADSVENLPVEKQREFVIAFESEISDKVDEQLSLQDRISADEAVNAVIEAGEKCKETDGSGVTIETPAEKSRYIIPLVISVVIAAAAVAVILILIKKKSHKEELKDNENI